MIRQEHIFYDFSKSTMLSEGAAVRAIMTFPNIQFMLALHSGRNISLIYEP